MILSDAVESAALFQWGVVLVASLVAALWDLHSRRIPNVLTLPLFAAGLLQAGVLMGFDGLKSSFIAAVILGLPYVLLYAFAGGGAGDAKLMAAIGAWLGIDSGIVALVAISACAVILAMLRAIAARRFFEVLGNLRVMVVSFLFFLNTRGKVRYSNDMNTADDPKALMIPYGPAIFLGLVIAAIYSFLR